MNKLDGKVVKKNMDDMLLKMCEYMTKCDISDGDRDEIFMCSAGTLMTASLDMSQDPITVMGELNCKLAYLQTKLNIEFPIAMKTGKCTVINKEE